MDWGAVRGSRYWVAAVVVLVVVGGGLLVADGGLTGLFAEDGDEVSTGFDASDPGEVLTGDAGVKWDATRRLREVSPSQEGGGDPGRAMEVAQIVLDYHAKVAGCGSLPEVSMRERSSDSVEAARSLIAVWDRDVNDAEMQELERRLNQLPEDFDSRLTRFLDAKRRLDIVVGEEYLQDWSEKEREVLRDLQRKVFQDLQTDRSEAAEITGDAPDSWSELRDVSGLSAAEKRVLNQIDVCRVLAAYQNMVETVPALADAAAELQEQSSTSFSSDQSRRRPVSTDATPVTHEDSGWALAGICLDITGGDSTWHGKNNYGELEFCNVLVDTGGSDTYENNAGASSYPFPDCFGEAGYSQSGCGVYFRSAVALDLQFGNDRYDTAFRDGGVAGSGYYGTGFLYDQGGNDDYSQTGGITMVNGGSGYRGVGMLVDGMGSDDYTVTCTEAEYDVCVEGVNGGGALDGSATLLDLLRGNDVYNVNDNTPDYVDVAGKEAVNGGATLGGSGLLYDEGGADHYQVSPDGKSDQNEGWAHHPRGAAVGLNGGAYLGQGLLYDEGFENDVYAIPDTAPRWLLGTGWQTGNGAAAYGSGLLVDGGGDETYTGPVSGHQGVFFEGVVGVLVDRPTGGQVLERTPVGCPPIHDATLVQEACQRVCKAPPTCYGYFCDEVCGTR